MAKHDKRCQKNANTWEKIAICIIIKVFLSYEDCPEMNIQDTPDRMLIMGGGAMYLWG